MILGMTWYQLVWNFLIYSVAGWCVEVVFHALVFHRVINRGFLNGPVCPVYGFGVVVVFGAINVITGLTAGRSIGDALIRGATDLPAAGELNIFALFIIGMILATLVELIGGVLLDVVYHTRWWDYSDEFLNFKGYICVKYSIFWGAGIVLVVKLIHPLMIGKASGIVPENIGWIFAIIFSIIYVADLIVSALVMFQINKELRELDEIRSGMRKVSNRLSYFLGETAFVAEEFSGKHDAQPMIQEDMNVLETREEFEASHKGDLEKAVEMRGRYENSWLGRGGRTVADFLKTTGESATRMAKNAAAAITGSGGEAARPAAANASEIRELASQAEALDKRRSRFSERFEKRRHITLRRITRAGEAFKSTRYQESMDKLTAHLKEIRAEKKKKKAAKAG